MNTLLFTIIMSLRQDELTPLIVRLMSISLVALMDLSFAYFIVKAVS